MTEFAQNLRRIRTVRKMTQEQLAKRCGLEPSHVNHFESGRREPSLENFRKLYKALRIGPQTLLGDDVCGESIYDTLPIEDIEFIDLVRSAVIQRHRKDIREIIKRDQREARK